MCQSISWLVLCLAKDSPLLVSFHFRSPIKTIDKPVDIRKVEH